MSVIDSLDIEISRFAGSEMSGITGIEVPVTERFSIGRKVVGTEKRESISSLASRSKKPVNFGLTGL